MTSTPDVNTTETWDRALFSFIHRHANLIRFPWNPSRVARQALAYGIQHKLELANPDPFQSSFQLTAKGPSKPLRIETVCSLMSCFRSLWARGESFGDAYVFDEHLRTFSITVENDQVAGYATVLLLPQGSPLLIELRTKHPMRISNELVSLFCAFFKQESLLIHRSVLSGHGHDGINLAAEEEVEDPAYWTRLTNHLADSYVPQFNEIDLEALALSIYSQRLGKAVRARPSHPTNVTGTKVEAPYSREPDLTHLPKWKRAQIAAALASTHFHTPLAILPEEVAAPLVWESPLPFSKFIELQDSLGLHAADLPLALDAPAAIGTLAALKDYGFSLGALRTQDIGKTLLPAQDSWSRLLKWVEDPSKALFLAQDLSQLAQCDAPLALEKYFKDHRPSTSELNSALKIAAETGQLSAVKILHEKGANLDECGIESFVNTPNKDVGKYLLGNGVDLTQLHEPTHSTQDWKGSLIRHAHRKKRLGK